jgi:hypothetical protein
MAEAIAEVTRYRWPSIRSGAQSPRPAPARPTAGASHPPGQALAYVIVADSESENLVYAGGEKQCFSFSAR